ncbi:germinal-center associated nuclear protein [Pseudophryne corroboree]|uniref:germinal-center associated nuclear protein n=1 Tax=Pseudophryne corroboree TaxID=495146 RepID=UPI0030820BE2
MNHNSLFGEQKTSVSNNQNNIMFGQTSLFGQSAANQSAATFGQAPIGQSPPMFGQLSSSQPASVFGQTTSQSDPAFGQSSTGLSASTFVQSSTGLSAPTFGQASVGQSSFIFGAAGQSSSIYSQASVGQSGSMFGQSTQPTFGQTSAGQSSSIFGQATAGQSAPTFGQTSVGQSANSTFGHASAAQSTPAFGQATSGHPAPAFGQATSGHPAPAFGQATSGHPAPAFGQATSGQPAPAFGQAQPAPAFGQATSAQPAPAFGQAKSAQPAPAFGQSTTTFGQTPSGQTVPVFGLGTTGESSSLFGKSTNTQSLQSAVFGQPSGVQTGSNFGQGNTSQASIFGLTATSQSASPFVQTPSSQSTSHFAQATTNQPASIFTQATAVPSVPSFGSSATIFGQAATGSSVFEQSSTRQIVGGTSQSSLFGQPVPGYSQNTTGQSFGQTASTQSDQANISQNSFSASGFQSAFGKQSTRQEPSSVPEFGQHSSAQPPSYAQATSVQTSTFGIASTAQSGHPGKTNVFGNAAGNASNTSTSSQAINVGQAFGASTQMTAGSIVPDSKLTTSMAATPFSHLSSMSSASSDLSFKPPANTIFKPIFTGTSKPNPISTSFTISPQAKSEVMEQPMFESPAASAERQSSRFFPFSSDKKSKDETPTSRPPFASVDSSFSSFTEDSRKEEGAKRKEDQSHSVAVPPDLHRDHAPVKRSRKLNRDLTGGANLLVRSLYDVVKSQMKTQHSKSPKKEEETLSALKPDSSASSHPVERSHLAGSGQTASVKTNSGAVASQLTFSKTQTPAPTTQTASRMLLAGRSHQAPDRDYSTAAASHLVSARVQPVLEEGELPEEIEETSPKTPMRKEQRSDSVDRSVPPSELNTISVKNLPPSLNQKQALENYFKKFGKIQRLYCRPMSKMAIIHFYNHNSAAAAKKVGKRLHRDVSIFWHRKKISPTKKETGQSKKGIQKEEREDGEAEKETSSTSSPLRSSQMQGLKGSFNQKSVFSKSLQFDVDSSDTLALSSDTTWSSQKHSLLHLVGTVAETAEEKYRLLDQRDRLLRQARVKRTELDQAKLFVGTCPDMCPEKERYMRETRKQLSVYEFFPGTDQLNHAAAIKEYSRSSADQEEPLPHELRPVPVLRMTMDYLVTHIMDQGEANYREWYDFVWNRTRGIRKDITQQHLSDPFTVSLMEKCTRFHIHCSYDLCEEPLRSFDPKINNENLTKCLQSLKEMYQDLHNRGETGTCEPEFRGYSVLLNLNKGDILREVQQFPEAVRNSEEVKFAVQVFTALNSTNIVRFFRLVRSASYLNSCVLHCYFAQIRRNALHVFNVAYTPSVQRPTLFPLENMVRLLSFQDTDEATEFLTAYGLCVSDGFVEFNRTSFAEPEVPLQPKRCTFISKKRQVSFGEVVNGAPLPQFTLHVPACSFDEQNKYTGSNTSVEQGIRDETGTDKPETNIPAPEEMPVKQATVLLPDTRESSSVFAQSVLQPPMAPSHPPSPPKPTFTDEDVAAVMEDIVEDTVREFSADLGQAGAAYISAVLGESSLAADKLLGDVIMDFSSKIAVDEVKAETERVKEEKRRKAEEARLILEKERMLSMVSQSQCEDLLNEVITEGIYKISSEELQQAVERDHKKRILQCSQHVCDQFVTQSLNDEVWDIAKETLCEMRCCSKYIQRWREVLAARKKLRRQMRGFPAAPGLLGRDGKLKALAPSAIHDMQNLAKGIVDLGNAGKLCVSVNRCLQLREQNLQQMRAQTLLQESLCDAAWKPLELPSLIVENLSPWKQCIFWKAVLALPEITELSDPSSLLSEWLKAKFCWAGAQPSDDQNPQVQTLTQYSSFESQEGNPVRVNVCVKVVHGPLTDTELEQAEYKKELLGTSGVLLLLPPLSHATDVYWLSALVQLKQLLQAKPFKPPPSLAVLVPGSHPDSEREVEEELKLPDLVSCGLISDYLVLTIPVAVNNLKGSDMVSSAVQFLLSHCPPPLEVASLPFQQYIEDGVWSAFSNPFYRDQFERRKSGLPSQDPAPIIDLYNDAIAFLAEAVSSKQLYELSWPITEFASNGSSLMPPTDWNSPDHLAALRKATLSFQIPQMDKPPPEAPWKPVCSMIMDYISQISQSSHALPLLISEVRCLLWRTRERCLEKRGVTGSEPSVQDIPWDDLIALCINHKLRDWEPPVDANGFHENLFVYFFKEDLKNFSQPESWEKAGLGTDMDSLCADNSPPCRRTLHLPVSHSLCSPCVTLEEQDNAELSYLKPLLSQLNRAVLAEKKENERYNERLQHLLEEEPLNASLSLPLYLAFPSLQSSLESAIVPSLQQSSVFNGFCSPTMPEPLADGAVLSNSDTTSLQESIRNLQMNLRAYQQEDIALSLHLSTLLEVAREGEPSKPNK